MPSPELAQLKTRLALLPPLNQSAADTLLRDSTVFARKTFGAESPHPLELQGVMFEHPTIIYNTRHIKVQEHWNAGVARLQAIFDSMEYELQLSSLDRKLEVPPKVTIKWLIEHVPVALWLTAAAIVVSIFSLGYSAGTSNFFARLAAWVRSAAASP